LGVVFDTCLGSGLEDDIFMEFDDLGLHLGVPGETILEHLLEINSNLQQVPKWSERGVLKWEGSASEVGVMGDSFEVRKGSKMWSQHAMLPAFGGAAD
jgi:hypothetical protein